MANGGGLKMSSLYVFQYTKKEQDFLSEQANKMRKTQQNFFGFWNRMDRLFGKELTFREAKNLYDKLEPEKNGNEGNKT